MIRLVKPISWIVALFSLVIATSGCGKSNSNTVAGVPGTATPAVGVGITTTGNGGIAITFSVQNAYFDYNPYNGQAVVLSAGPLPTNTQTFQVNNAPYGSWLFLNGARPGGSGTVSIGNVSGSATQI